MEDQGKRLLIALAIIALMWMVYVNVFAPKPTPPKKETPTATETAAGDAGPKTAVQDGKPGQPAAAPGTPVTPGVAPGAPMAETCDPARAPTLKLDQERWTATFSGCGGALSSFQLKAKQYEQKLKDGTKAPFELVRAAGHAEWYPLQIDLPDSDRTVPPGAEWKLTQISDSEIEARWPRTPATEGVEVVKRFQAVPGRYALRLTVTVTNRGATPLAERLALLLFGQQDPKAPEGGMFSYAPPRWGTVCVVNNKEKSWSVGHLADKSETEDGDIRWAGLKHKYFLLVAAPLVADRDDEMSCSARRVDAEGKAAVPGVMQTALVYPVFTIKPGESLVRTTLVYAGPKQIDELTAVAKAKVPPDEKIVDTKLEKAVDLGWFAFLGRPMLWLLKVYKGWLGNWGLAIILLTVTVKLLTLYWTQKSMKSMKAMSKLKPKMDEIREKFKDDKQRMNVEMMNLYKVHKINPLGGCLPMLLQMPIWLALYQTLNTAAELFQAPFIPGWLGDMTAPDPFYVMPVLMTGVMFLQQKITPAAVDSAQQKMLMYMMPLMFGMMSLVFPAGLTVYIFTNTILTMAHQFYMNKTDVSLPGTTSAAAATAERVPVGRPPLPRGSGGGGRGGGRKK